MSAGRGGLFQVTSRQPSLVLILDLPVRFRWCAFLDTMTEELQASSGLASSGSTTDTAVAAQYGDYRFVTRQQLEQMGVQDLIGTTYVKRYMHGYFMDSNLYRKLQVRSRPLLTGCGEFEPLVPVCCVVSASSAVRHLPSTDKHASLRSSLVKLERAGPACCFRDPFPISRSPFFVFSRGGTRAKTKQKAPPLCGFACFNSVGKNVPKPVPYCVGGYYLLCRRH